VNLRIFDLSGREKAVLINKKLNAGRHQIPFNGEDFSSGIYFYTLQTNTVSITKKMILIK
jgi:hypothetical protein